MCILNDIAKNNRQGRGYIVKLTALSRWCDRMSTNHAMGTRTDILQLNNSSDVKTQHVTVVERQV